MGRYSSGGGSGGGGGGGGIASYPAPTTDNAVLQLPLSAPPFAGPLTLDQVGAAFGIAFGGGGFRDVGSVINPTLSKSFSGGVPSSVILAAAALAGGATSDAAGLAAQDVTALPAVFTDPGTFTLAGRGSSVTRTITAHTPSSPTKAAATPFTAAGRNRWGHAAPGMGTTDVTGASTGRSAATVAAFILALQSSVLAGGRAGSFQAVVGAGEKFYFSTWSAAGVPTFTVGGFAGGFVIVATVAVTVNGITENYQLWESVQPSLGDTTAAVT